MSFQTPLKLLRKPVIIWALAFKRGEGSLRFARKAGSVLKGITTAKMPHQTERSPKHEEITHHKKPRGSQIPLLPPPVLARI